MPFLSLGEGVIFTPTLQNFILMSLVCCTVARNFQDAWMTTAVNFCEFCRVKLDPFFKARFCKSLTNEGSLFVR